MRLPTLLPLLLLAGCATSPMVEQAEPVSSIGQRLLVPESTGGQAGGIQPYELAGSEVFRMPEPLHAPLPELPAEQAMQSLPPVTVCLNVIVDAQGEVQRSFPLLAHSQCGAGNDVRNEALLQAANDAVRQWHFQPAAICRFPPGINHAEDDCTGAAEVEPVPVTLPYAFTYEVVQGRAQVRVGKPPH